MVFDVREFYNVKFVNKVNNNFNIFLDFYDII